MASVRRRGGSATPGKAAAPGHGGSDGSGDDGGVRAAAALLVFHGASVVFVALILSGAGYESAIVDGGGERTNQWRVAHSGGVQNGLLAMAVGAAQPYLVFTSRGTRARTALAFALMAWSNSVAYNLGAATGQRGLTPICLSLERGFPYLFCGEGLASLANVAVNAAFVVGMAATLYGFYQLLRAAHRGATEAAAA